VRRLAAEFDHAGGDQRRGCCGGGGERRGAANEASLRPDVGWRR